jgi:MFS transporter
MIDGIGVGFASAGQPYLPVFLTRLGASNLAIGLLASLPALSGLLFGVPIGRFLQSRRQVVPSFAVARLLLLSCYALTGLIPIFFANHRVEFIIAVWALATIPQSFINVCFTLVMAGVAGPEGRYYLMSRRWSILGVTTALTVAVAGQMLDRIVFPVNYEIVFVLLSLGAFVSFYYSSHIELPDQVPPHAGETGALQKRIRDTLDQVRAHPLFVRQTIGASVFRLGLSLALPLYPLYYVRILNVSDASIGWINTVQGLVLIVAYFFWSRISRNRGARFALLTTTLGLALNPLVVAFTTSVEGVIVLAGFAGIFQAGIDLVFFDTLVSSLPAKSSPIFVGIYQTTSNLALFLGPLIGTLLSNQITIPGALIAGAVVRLAGFATFFLLFKENAV